MIAVLIRRFGVLAMDCYLTPLVVLQFQAPGIGIKVIPAPSLMCFPLKPLRSKPAKPNLYSPHPFLYVWRT